MRSPAPHGLPLAMPSIGRREREVKHASEHRNERPDQTDDRAEESRLRRRCNDHFLRWQRSLFLRVLREKRTQGFFRIEANLRRVGADDCAAVDPTRELVDAAALERLECVDGELCRVSDLPEGQAGVLALVAQPRPDILARRLGRAPNFDLHFFG